MSTPLMREISRFTKIIVIATFVLASLNFLLGMISRYRFLYSLMASVALAVAAIPEGLPAILTITLALGISALARKNALVKKLPSVETLGCTTVICTDKTGTLTKNQMTVVKIYSGGRLYDVTGTGYEPKGEFVSNGKKAEMTEDLIETLRAGILCNDADLIEDCDGYKTAGDLTEVALVVSAKKAGINRDYPKIDEIPFESRRGYMATLHMGDDWNVIYVKGSPEKILEMCKYQLINGRKETLRREELLNIVNEMTEDDLRVLAFACKFVSAKKKRIEAKDLFGLIFLGFQGMIDPPRDEAIEAIDRCKKAGIRIVMVTGDHAETTKAIARRIGICDERDRVLTGDEMSEMSDDELYMR